MGLYGIVEVDETEKLHVDAQATDGWSTLDYLDADAIPVAFALKPESPTK